MILIFGSYLQVLLLEKFNIESDTSKIVIWVAFVLAMIPLIFTKEVFQETSRWEESVWFFWKRQHYSYTVKEQWRVMGVIPIGDTRTVSSEKTIDQPPAALVAQEIVGILPSFIPVVNSYVHLISNVARKSLPGR